jgi:hypothetical protein
MQGLNSTHHKRAVFFKILIFQTESILSHKYTTFILDVQVF